MKYPNSLLPCLNRLRLFTSIAIVIIFFFSCEKDPEPLFDNGLIKGYVELDDLDYGLSMGKDVKVIAHGPYGNRLTSSDDQGQFMLSGLGNGTYEIEFNKEGFGIWIVPGIKVFGNDTIILNARLYEKVDYKMPSLSAAKLAVRTDYNTPHEHQIRLFYSDTKEVNYKKYLVSEMTYAFEDGAGNLFLSYDPNPQIPNYGHVFEIGQTIYLIAYVCSDDDPGYFNEYYGLVIYSTVDPHQHSQIFKTQCFEQ